MRRILLVVVVLGLIASAGMAVAGPASAVAGSPYSTSLAQAWQVVGTPTRLYDLVAQPNGSVSYVPEGAGSGFYNALGFNPRDGYLYGVSQTPNADGTYNVVKVGQGGVIVNSNVTKTPLPTAWSPLPSTPYVAGTIDPATGTYYVGGTNNGMTALRVIDVASGTWTTMSLSTPLAGIADLVFDNGALWGLANSGDLYSINATTGAVTLVKAGAMPRASSTASCSSDFYGAGYRLGNGNQVWIDNCSGVSYELDMRTYARYYRGAAPFSTNNSDAASNPGQPTDLAVGKCGPGEGACPMAPVTATAGSYVADHDFTYTLTVFNRGPQPSTHAVVTDVLPAGETYVSSSNPSCRLLGSTVECATGPLAPGTQQTFTMTVHVAAGTTRSLVNTATVLGDEADPQALDNTVSYTVKPAVVPPPTHPAIGLVKSFGHAVDLNHDHVTDQGDQLWWTFTVTNLGDVTLHGARVRDALLASEGISVGCRTTTLAPGQSVSCIQTGAYRVTEGDQGRRYVNNVATAVARDPRGTPVVSRSSTVTTDLGVLSTVVEPVLPNTGGPSAPMLIGGLGAISAGLLLIVVARRRRTA